MLFHPLHLKWAARFACGDAASPKYSYLVSGTDGVIIRPPSPGAESAQQVIRPNLGANSSRRCSSETITLPLGAITYMCILVQIVKRLYNTPGSHREEAPCGHTTYALGVPETDSSGQRAEAVSVLRTLHQVSTGRRVYGVWIAPTLYAHHWWSRLTTDCSDSGHTYRVSICDGLPRRF